MVVELSRLEARGFAVKEWRLGEHQNAGEVKFHNSGCRECGDVADDDMRPRRCSMFPRLSLPFTSRT